MKAHKRQGDRQKGRQRIENRDIKCYDEEPRGHRQSETDRTSEKNRYTAFAHEDMRDRKSGDRDRDMEDREQGDRAMTPEKRETERHEDRYREIESQLLLRTMKQRSRRPDAEIHSGRRIEYREIESHGSRGQGNR